MVIVTTPLSLCPTCNAPLPPDAGGLCPACLLRAALTPKPEPFPRSFGRYELRGQLGKGGMGIVYRAWDPGAGREVALKMLRDRDADAGELERFQDEARKAAALRDEGIVRVFDVDVHDGAPYFTMELIDGGSLAQHMPEFCKPRAAAQLIADVASAVHHAHQRFVLHRDLKPANVLLDTLGKPHIADFGVARRLDAAVLSSSAVIGTLHYMAPEQISTPRDLTVAVDVYALGCILYELLSGRPPIDGATAAELVKNIESARPAALVDVDADLATICLKCLEKRRDDRYASAAGVAADLHRYLRDEPIAARPWTRTERTLRAIRRHPTVAVLAVLGVALLATVAVVAVQVAQAQEAELRADALDVNAYAARALSGAVLFELNALGEHARAAAADPAVRAVLTATGDERTRAAKAWRDAELGPFDSLLLLDADGTWISRVPEGDAGFVGLDFSWRDYFHGTAELARAGSRAIYVSRAYESRSNRTVRFSMNVAVYDDDGSFIGVLQAAVGSREALGDLALDDDDDDDRIATLVSRGDRQDENGVLPDEWYVVVHEGLAEGSSHLMPNRGALALLPRAGGEQLVTSSAKGLRDDQHRDPVAGFEGRWLAGVAPVGGTHFAVVVQTRYDAAIRPNERLGQRLTAAVLAAMAIAVVVGGLLYAWDRARRSRP
ncbi:MAG: serine/threonine protein kinase [Deltaproteobacteria bacterium]|nr:serine/threonine protein kinase [Deltaproteobacteria bacterium]